MVDYVSEDEHASIERCPICELIECEHTDDEKGVARARVAHGDEPIRLAHDTDTQQKQVRTAKKSTATHLHDLEKLLATDWGRRLAWAMLATCHPFELSYLRGGREAVGMAFAEGERNVGQQWIETMRIAAPEKFMLMLAEHWKPGSK